MSNNSSGDDLLWQAALQWYRDNSKYPFSTVSLIWHWLIDPDDPTAEEEIQVIQETADAHRGTKFGEKYMWVLWFKQITRIRIFYSNKVIYKDPWFIRQICFELSGWRGPDSSPQELTMSYTLFMLNSLSM